MEEDIKVELLDVMIEEGQKVFDKKECTLQMFYIFYFLCFINITYLPFILQENFKPQQKKNESSQTRRKTK